MRVIWHGDMIWRKGCNGGGGRPFGSVMSSQEPVCLPWRLEPPHDFLVVAWACDTADRDHTVIQMPRIDRPGPVPVDAGGKMRAEPVDPMTDRFAADDDTSLRRRIFDNRCAQRTPTIRPDRQATPSRG